MNNTQPQTIDVETVPAKDEPATPQMSVVRVEQGGAVGRAMTIDELHKNLQFIRDVMRKEMKEGQDYGKIPGTGEKPTLLQPGAQKLLMVFNLTERVNKETLREYPGFHREYEFIVTVRAPNGKEWDGVGTCSTLESKYRYRKAERKCPACGKTTIIMGKKFKETDPEPGWLCWKKKGGCDAHFPVTDPRITSQDGGAVENEDPADCWNTVRKMAFKRALVAAAINSTNTSELWTQDLEELKQNEETARERAQTRENAPRPKTGSQGSTPPRQSSPQPPPRNAPAGQNPKPTPEKRYATEKTREWLIKRLEPCRDLVTEYFRKLANPSVLLPNEHLEDLGLPYLPLDLKQAAALDAAITDFGNGGEAKHAFKPNELKPVEPPKVAPKPAPSPAPAQSPSPTRTAAQAPAPPSKRDPEWFWDMLVTVPPKGVKRDEYLKNPDTIRSLYTRMKEGDSEAGKRLWGFANHYEAKPWTARDGSQRQPSNADLVFRDALDAFLAWEEKHGEDTHGQPEPQEPDDTRAPAGHDYSPEPGDDVPF